MLVTPPRSLCGRTRRASTRPKTPDCRSGCHAHLQRLTGVLIYLAGSADGLKGQGDKGWLLDGFPRNMEQARKLDEALKSEGMKLDYVVEILLPRKVARERIMGRRLCVNNNNHPNNIFIDAIKPNGDVCRVCGGALKTRADDQDEAAINKRHDIYYDEKNGTLAAAHYFKDLAAKGETTYITLDGSGTIDAIREELLSKLK